MILSFSPAPTTPILERKQFVYQNLPSPPTTEGDIADIMRLKNVLIYQHYVNLLCLEFRCKRRAAAVASERWKKVKSNRAAQKRLYTTDWMNINCKTNVSAKCDENTSGVKKSLCADFVRVLDQHGGEAIDMMSAVDVADVSKQTVDDLSDNVSAADEVLCNTSAQASVDSGRSDRCKNGCEPCHLANAIEYLDLDMENFTFDHEFFSASRCRLLRMIIVPLYDHCNNVKAWRRARDSGRRVARNRRTQLMKDVDNVIVSTTELLDDIRVQENIDDYSFASRVTGWRKALTDVNNRLHKQTTQALQAIRKTTTVTAREVTQIFASPTLEKDGYGWSAALEVVDDFTDEDPETTRTELRQAAALIREAGVVSFAELVATVAPYSLDGRRRWLLTLIAEKFPVLIMTIDERETNCVIVDVWSWGDEHSNMTIEDRITQIKEVSPKAGLIALQSKRKRKQNLLNKHLKRGRIPTHITYPKLVEVVVDVIKQHQPRAHDRRRVDIIYTGVSLAEIKRKVAEQIPELANIDKRTIARLMVPPRHGVRAAAKYKSIINSKVTTATNDRRKLSRPEDVHFSHAVASFFQQMGAYLGHECLQLSGDEKTPLTLGHVGLVSRRIKNRHVTPTAVVVNHYDHDYQTSEYLLALSGFIELVSPDEYETRADTKGRDSVVKGTAGPAHLFMRPLMYDKPDLYSNVGDLRAILEAKESSGKLRPVLSIITDGGDGYKNTRMSTILLYGRIFRDFQLEGLILFRRAGGLSAYNNIEHLWSPISSALSGMVLGVDPHNRRNGKPPSACLRGDDLFEENVELLDECMESVREKLEQECPTYNGHEVGLTVLKTRQSAKVRENMNDDLHNQLHSSHATIMADENLKATFDEFRTIIKHAQLSTYQIVYTYCGDLGCDWVQCRLNSTYSKAPRWRKLLDIFKGIVPGACPHSELPDTYLNFLEVVERATDGFHFPHPDYHCPSLNSRMTDPKVCTRKDPPCSAHWTHVSANVRTEHDKQFHWDERQRESTQPPAATYSMKCKQCGQVTTSYQDAVEHASRSEGRCSFESADRQYRYWVRKPGLSNVEQAARRKDERARKRAAEVATTSREAKLHKHENAPSSTKQDEPSISANSVDAHTTCVSTRTGRPTISCGKNDVYDGAVDNFVIPPDDMLVPDKMGIGIWVFAAWTEDRSVTRGYVTKRRKNNKRVQWVVRFLNDMNEPHDYVMDPADLCFTRESANQLLKPAKTQACSGSNSIAHDNDASVYEYKTDSSGDEIGDGTIANASECKSHVHLQVLSSVVSVISLYLSNLMRVRLLSTCCELRKQLLSADHIWLSGIGYNKCVSVGHEGDASCLKRLYSTRVPLTIEEQDLACTLEKGEWQSVNMLRDKWAEDVSLANFLVRLQDGERLTSQIIDSYLEEIDKKSPSVRIMSTFWFTKVCEQGYSSVKRWAEQKAIDITSIDVLCFPINWQNAHWILSVINFRRKRFEVWDSLPTTHSDRKTKLQFEKMKEWLVGELTRYVNHNIIMDEWTCVVEDAPKQSNDYDCGVFTCMCAEYISLNVRPLFTQRDILYFRKRMLVKLANA